MAAAGFALDKLHMTLTILRKNKNTTTTNPLTPLSDLGLAQDVCQKKLYSRSDVSRAVLQGEDPRTLHFNLEREDPAGLLVEESLPH